MELNSTTSESDRRCACGVSVISVPETMRIYRCDGEVKRQVSVDACIASVISHLWECGIRTLNCCCGHGTEKPSIIFDEGMSDADAKAAEEAIAQVDGRKFDLLSWKLTKVNSWQK